MKKKRAAYLVYLLLLPLLLIVMAFAENGLQMMTAKASARCLWGWKFFLTVFSAALITLDLFLARRADITKKSLCLIKLAYSVFLIALCAALLLGLAHQIVPYKPTMLTPALIFVPSLLYAAGYQLTTSCYFLKNGGRR
ncbi:hypothetical protein A7X67_11535 [Clostridium sp. W14A]|nr:hypothetical protein A7X67_11535 [Clostridium sp. W14A]